MVNQKLMHIKIEYEKSLKSKKEILHLEKDLLNIAQSIKDYHSFRTKELNAKIKFNTKVKSFLTEIRKLQKILPKIETKENIDGTEKKSKKTKQKKYNPDIEGQLREIQNKLNALQK